MRTVGFFGGPSIYELGPVADVQLFFDCVNSLVAPMAADQNWPLITDRLYRRYVRPENLGSTQALMDEIQKRYGSISSSAVNWGNIASPRAVTRLDPAKPTLAHVFSAYFERFAHCRESAEVHLRTFNEYLPLKVGVTDLPEAMIDEDRPLEDYDSLDGEPFWKRA